MSSGSRHQVYALELGQIGDEEREARVDAPLVEERLKLGLDTLVEVVELQATIKHIVKGRERRETSADA